MNHSLFLLSTRLVSYIIYLIAYGTAARSSTTLRVTYAYQNVHKMNERYQVLVECIQIILAYGMSVTDLLYQQKASTPLHRKDCRG